MSPNGLSTGEENGYLPVATTDNNKTETTKIPPEETKENNESIDSEQSDDAEIVVPPDGGWGWVVVIASFLCNMVVDGIVYAFGMFLKDISFEFNVKEPNVAIIGSLLSGFYLMAGPFTSALANRYGFRLVAFCGSIVAALAFGLSYFATSIMYLCLMYGVVGGIGFGLIYVPAVISVGFYFEKFRALATGIAVCGSGVGTFVFAPFCAFLIEAIGWRYTLICQAGMVLCCILFASTFRPVKPTKLKNLKEKDGEKPELIMDSSKLNPTTRLKMEKALANMKADSTNSLNENNATIPRILGVSNNAAYPTAAQVWKTDANKVYHTISVPHHQRNHIYNKEKRPGIPFITSQDEKDKDEKTIGTTPLLDQEDGLKPVIMTNRRHTIGERRTKAGDDLLKRKNTHIGAENRPLYRDDIFFGASLTRLPQYTSQCSLGYNLSVTRPPTKHEIEEEADEECKFCPESIRRPLATMLDISVLKSISFLILSVSGLLTMLGFFVPFVYLKERAELNGIEASKAVWLVSTIGIANTIGRVVSGMISSFPKVNVLLVNNIALSIGGIATILSGLSHSLAYQYAYAVTFGLTMSCFASLRPILVVDLVGLDRLTNAFGIILLFQGVGACAGTPMAGQFFEATGSYDASFYLSGSLILASVVICYPLNFIDRWEKNRQNKSEEKSVAV